MRNKTRNTDRSTSTTSAERRAARRAEKNGSNDNQQRVVKSGYKSIALVPRNTAQEAHMRLLNNPEKRVVFAIGPAGTGKSYLSTIHAIKSLREGLIEKIIIVRPAVGAEGEEHGFLPGDLNEKLGPWLLPIIDIFEMFYSKEKFAEMVESGVIELSSLMYMRGRSFKDCAVIFDEAQNSLPSQMKLLLTRLGENTRAYITGDLDQTDHKNEANGLEDFIDRLEASGSEMIGVARFQAKHIERDPIVGEVLRIYNS